MVVIILVVVAGFSVWQFFGQKQLPQVTAPLDSVRLSAYLGEFSGLIWVAENKGYFKDNGLDVKITERQSGVDALNDIFAGNADISTQAEFVAVSQSFKRNDFKILASIDSISAIYMVGLKDHNINQIRDLKGKKIGVTQNSQAQFFLGKFLVDNNLKLSDVQIVYLKPADMVAGMEAGSIDAAVTWQPLVSQIEDKPGISAIKWLAQSNRQFSFLLTASNDLVKNKPQVVERFLKALVQAENVSDAEKEKIIKTRLKYQDAYMQKIWPNNVYLVTLNQGLLTLMKDEAQWMMENKITDSKAMPNFLDYVYFNGLETADPGAVTIVH